MKQIVLVDVSLFRRLGGSRWKSSKTSQEKQQVVPKSEIKPNRIKVILLLFARNILSAYYLTHILTRFF